MTELSQFERACRAAHEAVRAAQVENGEEAAPPWDQAPEWMRQATADGVRGALLGDTPQTAHDRWCDSKRDDGWRWGPTKDAVAKTRPCMVPWDRLPEAQRRKDSALLIAVAQEVDTWGLPDADETFHRWPDPPPSPSPRQIHPAMLTLVNTPESRAELMGIIPVGDIERMGLTEEASAVLHMTLAMTLGLATMDGLAELNGLADYMAALRLRLLRQMEGGGHAEYLHARGLAVFWDAADAMLVDLMDKASRP
ncbi:MAG: RyR domain-containing protein [Ramlibacter sp.]